MNTIAVLSALPYAIVPIVTALRVRGSKQLRDESPDPPPGAPLVSVIIPARNEAGNIERCATSVLATTYPHVEVIVVDDHSADGTGDIARDVAARDPRLRVVNNPPLPGDWFGKQWACMNGAREARGEILLFADADTVHSGDLLTRSVNAMIRRDADLFSVAGKQEIVTFWEKLVQPQVFAIMAVRYGGTESMTRSRFTSSKIANGQCLFVKRPAYDEMGGHALVKAHVADDMMMAQRFFARGKSVVGALGTDQLSTRMYTSLRELFEGWGKNVFVAGKDAVPLGWFGRLVFPILLLLTPLFGVAPAVVILAAFFAPLPESLLLWAALAQLFLLLWWLYVYWIIGEMPFYAVLAPLGAAMTFLIFLRAVLRGSRVTWKGRDYAAAA